MNMLAVTSVSTDRDDEEMSRREDRREGNRHCRERASKDKVLRAYQVVMILEGWPTKYAFFRLYRKA